MKKLAIIPTLVLALFSASQAREAPVGKVKTRKTASTRLYIETNPPGATITLNGKVVAVSNGLFTVAPRKHRITVTLPGYETVGRTVNVRKKRIGELRIDLKRLPGPASTSGSTRIPSLDRSALPVVSRGRTSAMPEPPPIAILEGHLTQINTIEFSPDKRFLATASSDNTVRVWEVPSGRLRHVLMGHSPKLGVYAARFSPDGKVLAICSGAFISRWDVETGKRHELNEIGHTRCVAYSPDGGTLAVGTGKDTVTVCDADSLEVKTTLRTTPSIEVWGVKYSPDGSLIACCGGEYHRMVPIMVWDVVTGEPFVTGIVAEGRNWDVAFSPDGKSLAVGGSVSFVALWKLPVPTTANHTDANADRPRPATLGGVLSGHDGAARHLTYSPDGKWLACSGGWNAFAGGRITIWDTTKNSIITTFDTADGYPRAITFAGDGKLIAYTSKANAKIIKTEDLIQTNRK